MPSWFSPVESFFLGQKKKKTVFNNRFDFTNCHLYEWFEFLEIVSLFALKQHGGIILRV